LPFQVLLSVILKSGTPSDERIAIADAFIALGYHLKGQYPVPKMAYSDEVAAFPLNRLDGNGVEKVPSVPLSDERDGIEYEPAISICDIQRE
jgi:hypothetical protein